MSTLAIAGLVALVVVAILLSFKFVRRVVLVVGLLSAVLLTLLFIDGKVTFGEVGETVFKWSRKATTAIDDATGGDDKGDGTRLTEQLDSLAGSIRTAHQTTKEARAAQADLAIVRDPKAKATDRLDALRRLADKRVPLVIDGKEHEAEEVADLVKKLEK